MSERITITASSSLAAWLTFHSSQHNVSSREALTQIMYIYIYIKNFDGDFHTPQQGEKVRQYNFFKIIIKGIDRHFISSFTNLETRN